MKINLTNKKRAAVILAFILFFTFVQVKALSTSSSSYKANIIVGTPGGHSTSTSYKLDLIMGQPLTGLTNSSAYKAFLGFFYGAYYGEGVNYLPEKVTLASPSDATSDSNRTPTFTWNAAYDANGDTLTYQFLLSNDTSFTHILYNVTSISGLSYTIPTPLDVDKSYFWKVRANDSYGYGPFSDTWNYTVFSLQAIQLVTDTINFRDIQPGESNDTTDNSPPPLILENSGNINVNVTVNASSSPFEKASLGTRYFQAKAGNYEAGSINLTTSRTTWLNLTTTPTSFIKELKWQDSSDSARIDIKIEVPLGEPIGQKETNITLEVE